MFTSSKISTAETTYWLQVEPGTPPTEPDIPPVPEPVIPPPGEPPSPKPGEPVPKWIGP